MQGTRSGQRALVILVLLLFVAFGLVNTGKYLRTVQSVVYIARQPTRAQQPHATPPSPLHTSPLAAPPPLGRPHAYHFSAIMVFSARQNFLQRSAIRETWARSEDAVVRFFVGESGCTVPQALRKSSLSCEWKAGVAKAEMREDEALAAEEETVQRRLREEQEKFADVVTLPMVDAYDKLSTKLKLALDWTVANTNSSWVFKIDDDCYARLAKVHALAKECGAGMRVMGFKNVGVPVRKQGRFADFLFNERYYPAYPNGGVGYGITRDLAEYMASRKQVLYPNEDTCIALWLRPLKGVQFCWRNQMFIQDIRKVGKTCLHPGKAIVGHKFNATQLRGCFAEDTES